jgi:ComF family protein
MKTMKGLHTTLENFFALFYPHLCFACEKESPVPGEILCSTCNATMPEAKYHLQKENPMTERFWGRVPVRAAAAMYIFTKESPVQHLLHNFKYKGKKEIGGVLGRRFGRVLALSPHFAGIEMIIPVPLHRRKEIARGYNQSEMFARGLSEVMKRPMIKNGLLRTVNTSTQTQKSKLERFENVADVFAVNSEVALHGRHILVVDDVLTTGSTLEACAQKILEVPDTVVSFATIAIASH